MNLFRIRGIQLAVHVSFLLLVALVAQEGWADDRWTGLFWNVATLLVFFTCVILHELGHSFTAMRFGVGVRRILLMPIGGMAEFDSIPREPSREFLITLAGPAVNFVIAAALWFAFGTPEGWPGGDADFPASAVGFAQPPVAFGEHNDYVYREVIGVSDAEYDALKAAGHVSMDYDASVP